MKNFSACRVVVGILVVLLAGTSCSQHKPVSRHTPPPPDGNPVHLHLVPYDKLDHSRVSVQPAGSFEASPCVQSRSCFVYLDYVDANHSGESLAWPTCPAGVDACLIVNPNPTSTSSEAPFNISSRQHNQIMIRPYPVNGQFVLVLSSKPL